MLSQIVISIAYLRHIRRSLIIQEIDLFAEFNLYVKLTEILTDPYWWLFDLSFRWGFVLGSFSPALIDSPSPLLSKLVQHICNLIPFYFFLRDLIIHTLLRNSIRLLIFLGLNRPPDLFYYMTLPDLIQLIKCMVTVSLPVHEGSRTTFWNMILHQNNQ